jgi:hypothetical protein
VDRRRERANEVTRRGPSASRADARCADARVLVVEASRQQDGLLKTVERRRREALAQRQVSIHAENSRGVDVAHGERVSFVGCDGRRRRSRPGAWRAW